MYKLCLVGVKENIYKERGILYPINLLSELNKNGINKELQHTGNFIFCASLSALKVVLDIKH